MKRSLVLLALLVAATLQAQQPPDYSAWNALLAKYYDPAHGMDYRGLKAREGSTLEALKQRLGRVDVAALGPKDQLAYWINVYNVNSVATVVESYPVDSIRDLSTDPIVRLNVFKKARVPFRGTLLSLDQVENEKIRERFHDPRIHFAINCAAKSCPPIRTEAYVGSRLDAQLDDQARRFLTGPLGARFETKGDTVVIHLTKIMDWFSDDFQQWAGGRAAFLRRYLPADKLAIMAPAKTFEFEFDEYEWVLNDWKRASGE